jgi:hypothetical protein
MSLFKIGQFDVLPQKKSQRFDSGPRLKRPSLLRTTRAKGRVPAMEQRRPERGQRPPQRGGSILALEEFAAERSWLWLWSNQP